MNEKLVPLVNLLGSILVGFFIPKDELRSIPVIVGMFLLIIAWFYIGKYQPK
jgi:hypothetical protein